jgi:Ca2+-binding RTX toxin-like protein
LGGEDVFVGGPGRDLISALDAATGSIVVNLTTGQVQGTGTGSDTVSEVEGAVGTPQGDTLIGNAGNNVLSGLEGDDTINGEDGDDDLFGGPGDDALDGGSGSDSCFDGETVLNCEA